MSRHTKQGIRPSQFILTYGPGAILEGENGPRIILNADIGLFDEYGDVDPRKYRIDDNRMSKGLLGGSKIYRLPTPSEVQDRLYATKPFPGWSLCVRPHGNNRGYLLHKGKGCPMCGSNTTGIAIRFVMACRNGHLDDVSWNYQVHGGSECPNASSNHITKSGDAFYWRSSGGTLRGITIQCINCESDANFGRIYYNTHRCSGRNPQGENKGQPPVRRECGARAKVIARQSASLRLTETKTLLSIRPVYTHVHRMLQDLSSELIAASANSTMDKTSFDNVIRALENSKSISTDKASKLRNERWETVNDALEFIKRPVPETYHDLLMEEFGELRKASVYGAPPQSAIVDDKVLGSNAKVIFEANRNDIALITSNGAKFVVTPIQRLRTVTVQKGFRREISGANSSDEPTLVDISFVKNGAKWYPGVEYMGEGIFIRLDGNDGWANNPSNPKAAVWLEKFRSHDRAKYPEYVFRNNDARVEMHPWFVWWHTLAHLLIRTMGEYSGYSSAAIRERVYFENDGDKRARGGILLYATQPGNEGTMGGLVGMAPHMKELLDSAFETSELCSGDPLCSDSQFREGGYNGAACYACLLNSETTCEHRNMWLDRNILNEVRP